ncbi:MAG: Crp/Fnr family transcriptional regulator [Sphingomonadaceae bacterium]
MAYCDSCLVRNRAICSGLDSEEILALNAIGRRRTLNAGEALVWEGDESVLVANVIEGVLKLSSSTSDGREQIVGVAFPSDFIGRPFGPTTPHGITALTDAEVCVFSRPDFDRFAAEHPALEHKLLERTLEELDRSRSWMLLLARKTAEEKVASFLLEMSDRLGETTVPGCLGALPLTSFDLPFSRQQVADILGLTIETVSRQLTRMKKDGILDLPARRTIVIRDRSRLEELAD